MQFFSIEEEFIKAAHPDKRSAVDYIHFKHVWSWEALQSYEEHSNLTKNIQISRRTFKSYEERSNFTRNIQILRRTFKSYEEHSNLTKSIQILRRTFKSHEEHLNLTKSIQILLEKMKIQLVFILLALTCFAVLGKRKSKNFDSMYSIVLNCKCHFAIFREKSPI